MHAIQKLSMSEKIHHFIEYMEVEQDNCFFSFDGSKQICFPQNKADDSSLVHLTWPESIMFFQVLIGRF